MKRLLPLLLLLLAAPASAQNFACVGTYFLPSGASTFTVTCASHGTPVGSVITGNYALSYETDAVDGHTGLGFDDYTNAGTTGSTDEDGLLSSDTDACNFHSAADGYRWMSPGACIFRRGVDLSTTTDGTTHTPDANTNLYGGITVNLHANSCHAFSAGATTIADNTFAVTHGLGQTPTFGIFAYTGAHDGNSNHGKNSFGFFNDNGGSHIQKSFTRTVQAGATDGTYHSRLFSDRVGGVTDDSSGAENQSIELTANNSTSTTFTARTATLSGDLVGILCYEPDLVVWVGNIDSPDSASSDWNETTANLQPQFMMSILTNETTEDTTRTDNEIAGTVGIFVTDFTTEATNAVAGENAADPTNTESRIDRNLYLADHDGTDDYNMTSMTAETTGIKVTAANITTADAVTHLWPTIMIGTTAAVDNFWWNRRRQ